jgi:hypothetical protein
MRSQESEADHTVFHNAKFVLRKSYEMAYDNMLLKIRPIAFCLAIISDCFGRTVSELNIPIAETELTLRGLSDGVYFFRLHNSVKKIIKSSY